MFLRLHVRLAAPAMANSMCTVFAFSSQWTILVALPVMAELNHPFILQCVGLDLINL